MLTPSGVQNARPQAAAYKLRDGRGGSAVCTVRAPGEGSQLLAGVRQYGSDDRWLDEIAELRQPFQQRARHWYQPFSLGTGLARLCR